MLIFSSASSFLPWTSHLHQQDLGDRGKMLLLPLQVAPKCLDSTAPIQQRFPHGGWFCKVNLSLFPAL